MSRDDFNGPWHVLIVTRCDRELDYELQHVSGCAPEPSIDADGNPEGYGYRCAAEGLLFEGYPLSRPMAPGVYRARERVTVSETYWCGPEWDSWLEWELMPVETATSPVYPESETETEPS